MNLNTKNSASGFMRLTVFYIAHRFTEMYDALLSLRFTRLECIATSFSLTMPKDIMMKGLRRNRDAMKNYCRYH